MKKFLVIYTAPTSVIDKIKTISADDRELDQKNWLAWAERCGDALVDWVPPSQCQDVQLKHEVSDHRAVVGGSILQTEHHKDACALTEDHPHRTWHEECDIEVHEYEMAAT